MLYTGTVSSLSWLGSMFHDSPRMIISVSLGAGIMLYYLLEVVKKPIFACRTGSRWRVFLSDHLNILEERYWPTFWCFESRAQTILASVFRYGLKKLKYRREIIKLKDGGQASLDWLVEKGDTKEEKVTSTRCGTQKDESDQARPVVVLLPGLTGSSQSEYIKSFVLTAQEAGAHVVVFNNRGRGGIELKTVRTYCAANSDDFEEALIHIRKCYPHSKMVAAGISLGGMIVGNFVSTRGEEAARYLCAAMALSIPWNVFIGTDSLERPLWNLLLNRHLASCLCESVKCMKSKLEGDHHPWDLDFVLKSKTIREFDSRFTALQFGYEDVNAYYREASLHDKIDRIRVPFVCLSAADDPFQPLVGIPLKETKESSHVAIVVTSHGGHIGFMEGILPINNYYSDRLFAQLLAGVFNSPEGTMEEIQREAHEFLGESRNSGDREGGGDNDGSENELCGGSSSEGDDGLMFNSFEGTMEEIQKEAHEFLRDSGKYGDREGNGVDGGSGNGSEVCSGKRGTTESVVCGGRSGESEVCNENNTISEDEVHSGHRNINENRVFNGNINGNEAEFRNEDDNSTSETEILNKSRPSDVTEIARNDGNMGNESEVTNECRSIIEIEEDMNISRNMDRGPTNDLGISNEKNTTSEDKVTSKSKDTKDSCGKEMRINQGKSDTITNEVTSQTNDTKDNDGLWNTNKTGPTNCNSCIDDTTERSSTNSTDENNGTNETISKDVVLENGIVH